MKARSSFPLALFPSLFLIGAVGYYLLEVLFRGHSHWSMALCGGICLCFIYAANQKLRHRALLFRALVGALIITGIEFLAGCILNLYLGWDIWNYSHFSINLAGQITPVFSTLWFLMSIPLCAASSLLYQRLTGKGSFFKVRRDHKASRANVTLRRFFVRRS